VKRELYLDYSVKRIADRLILSSAAEISKLSLVRIEVKLGKIYKRNNSYIADLNRKMDIKEVKYSDKIILPSKGDTVAIASRSKTAALCYDKIWSPLYEEVPESLRCFGGSKEEIAFVRFFSNPELAVENIIQKIERIKTLKKKLKAIDKEMSPISFTSLFSLALKASFDYALSQGYTNLSELPKEQLINISIDALKSMVADPEKAINYIKDNVDILNKPLFRKITKSFYKKHKIPLVPIYNSVKERDIEYYEGDRKTIVIALSNIKIVDEDKLTWEQVLEFRRDKEVQKKYRRLLHWLERDMIGKSQAFVEDEIAEKLEDYENALNKYSIKTIIGTIEETLDGKYLLGATGIAGSLTLAGHPTLSMLAAGLLLGGKIGLKLMQTKLDFDDVERGANSEISWVYEAKKLGK